MRHAVDVSAVALLLFLGGGGMAREAQAEDSFTRRLRAPAAPFVTELAPYGDWLDVEPFGTVWRPSEHEVGADFIPYASRGRWAYAPVGWVFLSDWSWGWATFHYGYWLFDPSLGWLWVPGTQWAPAWVAWRVGGGIVGWAPLGPPAWDWPPRWCFTSARDFTDPFVSSHLFPHDRHYTGLTRPLPRAPAQGGRTWPVGPEPSEIAVRDDARVPTVGLQPPAEGRVARVETGPVVEQPPSALGGEWGPQRTTREEPVGKPRREREPQAPERPSTPPAPTAVTLPMPPPPAENSTPRRGDPADDEGLSRAEQHRRALDLDAEEAQGTGGAAPVAEPSAVAPAQPPPSSAAGSAHAPSPAERHGPSEPAAQPAFAPSTPPPASAPSPSPSAGAASAPMAPPAPPPPPVAEPPASSSTHEPSPSTAASAGTHVERSHAESGK
ncbi:hypothetical protein FGE12_13410 [Aggregicoccus sp. 17bor-14]|uniref:DUF6600 domain-containing protein n=1 Tax=Myxococcaceae TaxID=31 RepID=UPI00129C7095|nr:MULTISPECIES: DUF6600 domain-containing protein [Myxococcaceae]MBF5043389.1 hypothetical protein [Simulacricoccus sp. 17bor-14]MRI89147.1 hypothetical protein [Aggregicoccus sp. 17bor-14]